MIADQMTMGHSKRRDAEPSFLSDEHCLSAIYAMDVRCVMAAEDARDESDEEIERCLGGCVGAHLLIPVAKFIRAHGLPLVGAGANAAWVDSLISGVSVPGNRCRVYSVDVLNLNLNLNNADISQPTDGT